MAKKASTKAASQTRAAKPELPTIEVPQESPTIEIPEAQELDDPTPEDLFVTSSVAEDVKEMASGHAAEMPDANELLDSFSLMRGNRAKAKKKEEAEKWIFYLRCHVCHQPGIWFTKNPVGVEIVDSEWHSTYKRIDQTWPHPKIPCQSCIRDGRESWLTLERPSANQRSAKVLRGHPFSVNGRHQKYLLKTPRDPEERARRPVQRAVPPGSAYNNATPYVYPEADREDAEASR
jgi:hypothetical protein